MKKPYFGSIPLKITVHTVKSNFPDCKVFYGEDTNGKFINFKFTTEDRKEYKLSEENKKYWFVNGHLILNNGPINPFKYDKLDALIEETELKTDVFYKRECFGKIMKALDSCLNFHETTDVEVGNFIDNNNFDIKFTLNGDLRAYHIGDSLDIHLQKIDVNTELKDSQIIKLKDLPNYIQFRILKTTHPGLLTDATKFISGFEKNEEVETVTDFYVKTWRKSIYKQMGIDAFDVLSDTTDSILVGDFVNNPMRHLVLFDGKEFAYSEKPLAIIPYEEYLEKRNEILNNYKRDVMKVCKETGILHQKAIEKLNVYENKNANCFIFNDVDNVILEIKEEILKDPFLNVVEKVNRFINLNNTYDGFKANIRKLKDSTIRKIDVNENGMTCKIDIDLKNLLVSDPYTQISGIRKEKITNKKATLTKLFIEKLTEEFEKLKNTVEYKTYLFGLNLAELGFNNENIIKDKDIKKVFYRNHEFIIINPYKEEIEINVISDQEKIKKIFKEIY
jgi:hypothetical protein